MPTPTLYVYGDLCVDIVAIPAANHRPLPGEDATLDHLGLVCGGAAYNTAVAAAQAGAQVQILGLIGDDGFGRFLTRRLIERGVDTTHLATSAHARTGAVLSLASPGGERTLYSFRGANAEPFTGSPSVQKGDAVALSGYSLQTPASRATALQLKQQAIEAEALCLLDPSFQSAPTLAQSGILENLDWITPNAIEAERMTGLADPRQAAAELRALGVRNVVITLAFEGCLVATPTIIRSIPAQPIPDIAHSTGAGDAFCGGLLAALLAGAAPLEAAQAATRAAARAIADNGKK